jgi:hypothetical protein
MHTAEDALIQYKQNHSGQLPEAEAAEVQQLSQLKADFDYLTITAHDNDLKRTALQARLAQLHPISIMEQTVSESPSEAALKGLEARRAELIADSWLPTSDRIRGIDSEAARLREIVAREQRSAAASDRSGGASGAVAGNVTETKLRDNPAYQDLSTQLTDSIIDQQTQQARMALMQQQIAAYEQDVRALPTAQRDLADRTRDYDVVKKQFEDLLERREQERIKGSVDRVSSLSSFQPLGAVVAESTAGRKKQAILIVMSMVLGLVVATALVIMREWADTTLYYPEDAERFFAVPVLALLPATPSLALGASRNGAIDASGGGAHGAQALPAAPTSAANQE